MDQEEYRSVVRSLIAKFITSTIAAAITAYLALLGYIHLDVYSSFIVGFLGFFCAGTKFFPESSKFISRRTRNYRRAKKGLAPLDLGDEPSAEIIPNFQRRT